MTGWQAGFCVFGLSFAVLPLLSGRVLASEPLLVGSYLALLPFVSGADMALLALLSIHARVNTSRAFAPAAFRYARFELISRSIDAIDEDFTCAERSNAPLCTRKAAPIVDNRIHAHVNRGKRC